jgi:hypothetical protein
MMFAIYQSFVWKLSMRAMCNPLVSPKQPKPADTEEKGMSHSDHKTDYDVAAQGEALPTNDMTDALPGNALDTLIAMVERGPLKSGDIPSKAGRSTLLEIGYAAQVAHTDGEWVCAATPKGVDAYIARYGGKTLDEAKQARLNRFLASRAPATTGSER